jgi:NAD/NADP transhydrogenase beta subunit
MSDNLIPKIALAGLVLFLAYSWWGLSHPTQALTENIFSAITMLLVLAAMVVAAMRAYEAEHRFWLVLVILSPPLGIFYALVVNRGGKSPKARPGAVA